MAKNKKKKRTPESVHRTVQDTVQFLPMHIEQQEKEGKRFRVFMLRYFTTPMFRVVNRILNASRYRGEAGQKLKQTERMKRHLEHRKAAIKHVHGQLEQARKKKRAQ
jgi:hypothetical protein